jgi:F-type H+-transporting ATPase subunit gamma
MSQLHAVRQRLHVYGELRQIMGAMKNIALMELHKLTGLLEAQRDLLGAFEQAAADFFAGHPNLLPAAGSGPPLIVAVGTERGFCGDFNETVLRALQELPPAPGGPPAIVLVGGRLARRDAPLPGVAARLEGPAVIDEVRPAIQRLLGALTGQPDLAARFSLHNLVIIHHQERAEGPRVRLYRPREAFDRAQPTGQPAARLLLPPPAFLGLLIEQYLHAALYSVFYDSLAAENHRRVAHMQGALNRIDERMAAGRMRMNALRQEEITEQIEEIMLSAEALLTAPEDPR